MCDGIIEGPYSVPGYTVGNKTYGTIRFRMIQNWRCSVSFAARSIRIDHNLTSRGEESSDAESSDRRKRIRPKMAILL